MVGNYQRAFKKLYKIAEVKNGHAHRWRDTFAVELLLAGVPLEQVSILLGHASIRSPKNTTHRGSRLGRSS